jgi:nucleotide-binding universal stress UspA family protein
MYQKILVPIDGSETATRGLREALKLATGTQATVRLVHIVNTASLAMAYADSPSSTSNYVARLLAAGKEALQEAEAIVKQAGLKSESVELETMNDNTGELLIDQAKQWPADLIAMGTHGRRGLGRLVMGSTSEYVLRHTSIPMLLVRIQTKS